MAEHLELVAEIPKVEKLTVQERLEYAKKRRAQQIRRWEKDKDSDSGPPPRKKKYRTKPLAFEPQFMLLDAATRGDVYEVKSMLENGIDPNICNDDGLTALHQACIDGREEIIDILLEYGANLDSVDRELWTPLHAATACGNEDIVDYLLDQGANIVAINADGNMSIDLAEDDEELREILEAEMEEQGYTEEKLMQLKEEEEKKLLSDIKNEMSADDDMDLDKKNDQGATFVHIAAANCYEDALEFLLESGAGVDIVDKDGWQPIHGAAVWGNERIIEMLVDSGADLDAKTPTGETPLSLCEDPELQQFLVDLKNKVKANKIKSARRKRSNSRSLSVKRTSLKDKISISHNEAKAEAILRVHPQLAFLLPKGTEGKGQDKNNKPMDTTPAVTAGQATHNSTTTNITNSRETRHVHDDKTSSLTRPKGKENIDPVTRGDNIVAKDAKVEDSGATERKTSVKITVKTHTTIIDNKPAQSEENQKHRSQRTPRTPGSPRSPRTQRSPRTPGESKPDVTIATSHTSDHKESNSFPRDSKKSSTPACSVVSISHSGPQAASNAGVVEKPKTSSRPVNHIGSPNRTAQMDPLRTSRDYSPTRKPQTGSGAKSDTPTQTSDIAGGTRSFIPSKPKEEPKSNTGITTDMNSNSKPVADDTKFNYSSKTISNSSDNIGPRTDSDSGPSTLPKSTKARHAPPPPIPRSSGSLSRGHEPEDTSGYPDSFSKKSRNSRENILEVVATGRLATPETKPISSGDVKIEAAAGTAKYTPAKQPYSKHDKPTNQPTNRPTNQPTNRPTNRPTNQPTNKPTNQPTNKPTNQPTNKPTNQPTNHNKQPYTERYTKRDDNDTLSNDRVLYHDHVDVEREKKACCVMM